MKNCAKCGAPLKDNSKFCDECGAPQALYDIKPEGFAPPPADGGQNPGANGAGMALTAFIVGIASLLIYLFSGFGLFNAAMYASVASFSLALSAAIAMPLIALIAGVVAVCLGAMAKKRLPVGQTGLATAGFVLGLITVILCAISIILVTTCFGIACGAIEHTFADSAAYWPY